MSGCKGGCMATYSEGMLFGLLCDLAHMLETLKSRLESFAVPRGWPSTAAVQNIVFA